MDVTAIGRAGLSKGQQRVGNVIARPVAERTRWSEEQILGVIGAALLALALYRAIRGIVRATQAARTSQNGKAA